jgi:hypothetical protein
MRALEVVLLASRTPDLERIVPVLRISLGSYAEGSNTKAQRQNKAHHRLFERQYNYI